MSLAEKIETDKQAVADAQSALDAANAALAADQSAFDAAQPHVELITKIEADLELVGKDFTGEVAGAVAAAKQEAAAILAQLRNLFAQ